MSSSVTNLHNYEQIEKQFFIVETLYTKIGPKNLKMIIDSFYDLVFDESSIAHLFKTDKSTIRDKQYMFLTQFLGGPQLYSERYGHPKMRLRHSPHAIDTKAKEEWLRCMRIAIDKSNLEDDLKDALYNCFPMVAAHMVNQ